MAGPFNVITVPVIEVTIDKTGPAGPPGVGGEEITAHMADNTDPHGGTLVQTNLDVKKALVGVVDGGVINSSQTINFANGGCHTYTATGELTLTITSLGVGQRGGIHILAGVTVPVISWTGVDVWLNGPPIFEAGKLTVITLFNDGSRIIGSFSKQS